MYLFLLLRFDFTPRDTQKRDRKIKLPVMVGNTDDIASECRKYHPEDNKT
ncbi:hypothetical protein HMPREF0208_02913 [Citrobacter koseri]|nr:hypothetical protein HMPREF3207_04587 [Citrobacter koseri]KWZ99754.1 hypothetical protein HMPREF3220_02010 [Citrobacter koseri]KXB42905.1 hypothetical protein HMPREF0208_02913 [Citrobacter koseri]